MNDSNLAEHLANTIDGLSRAATEADRRMFRRAALRGACAMAGALHKALRLLVAVEGKVFP